MMLVLSDLDFAEINRPYNERKDKNDPEEALVAHGRYLYNIDVLLDAKGKGEIIDEPNFEPVIWSQPELNRWVLTTDKGEEPTGAPASPYEPV